MSEGIAYQNKDIEFKVLSEVFKEKSFAAYGLDLPKIKEVLPTNLPMVSVNELRMDNLFLLEDGTYALVDYESANNVKNRIKYMNYIARITKRLYEEHGDIPEIRMIVIYTGNVAAAKPSLDVGCMVLSMEQVFVGDIPAEEIYNTVKRKLGNGDKLTEQELMQLIILPLAERGKDAKQRGVERVINLAKHIGNEQEQKFVFAGLLVISDKFIGKSEAEAIRREISMTKVGRMIFEDGAKNGAKKERIIAVVNMLGFDIPEDRILEKYSESDLEEAKKALEEKKLLH